TGRDGVELVVVTAGAGDGVSQECLAQHVDLVIDAVGLLLADVHWRLLALAHPEKAGRQDRLVEPLRRMAARLGQQVAGKVLDDRPAVPATNPLLAVSRGQRCRSSRCTRHHSALEAAPRSVPADRPSAVAAQQGRSDRWAARWRTRPWGPPTPARPSSPTRP